jgi:hypothetical protein
VNLSSPIGPLAEIRKQAVMDATESHTLVSANALPGQILARIMSALRGLRVKFGNTHRRPKPNSICLGSSGSPSMKRSGRKDSGSSYISGFRVIALRDISKHLSQLRLVARERYRPYVYHYQRTLGNMISKILVSLRRCMGNPCRERK